MSGGDDAPPDTEYPMNRITVSLAIRIPNFDGFGGNGYVQVGVKSYANQKTADSAIAKFRAEHGDRASVMVRA
jgi:hypothetical protein